MKAIVCEDEPIMLRRFVRLGEGLEDLELVGIFTDPREALEYAHNNPVDVAFLDVEMPHMSGITLAERLREVSPAMLVVFVSVHEGYVWDSNRIGADYYIVKPYTQETLEMTMERLRLLARRQRKPIYIQTFGRLTVTYEGRPVPLRGKAKEILAYIVTKRGREVSNEEIYRTIWESREYSNYHMAVYYNALHRLRRTLQGEGILAILQPTANGQMVDTRLFDCDYYEWLDDAAKAREPFQGEFLTEYSWAEPILADLLRDWSRQRPD